MVQTRLSDFTENKPSWDWLKVLPVIQQRALVKSLTGHDLTPAVPEQCQFCRFHPGLIGENYRNVWCLGEWPCGCFEFDLKAWRARFGEAGLTEGHSSPELESWWYRDQDRFMKMEANRLGK